MNAQRMWSISAARAYWACPRQWWLTSVVGATQESDYASTRGTVLHAGLAAGYAEQAKALAEGRAMVVAQRRAYAALEHAVCRAAARLDHEDVDEAIDTAAVALRHLGPTAADEVLGVERRLDIVVDAVPIQYWADVLYRRSDRVLVVRDWKSRPSLPSGGDLTRDRQLALGALCAARTFGDTVVEVEIASIGSAVAVRTGIDPSAARDAGRVVAETAHRAAADTEFRPTPGAVCSSCKVRASCPLYAPDGVVIPTPGSDVPVTTGGSP